jgi:hypothetical protein
MMENTRELLRRNLSPEAFNNVRYYWWQSSSYLPRLVVSPFVRHAPKVHSFPGQSASGFVQQLRGTNVFAPTQLCRVMTRHGSDKGHGWHNYTTVYSVLFEELRQQRLRIFELGVGTNNPARASSMGANGRPGASLRGWREFFPQALVYGADIDHDILFEEDRIKTFYCDQCDGGAIRNLWAQPGLREAGMDIIIDDGLHTFEGNRSFFEGSLGQLRAGGFYVIEDIDRNTIGKWLEVLERVYSKRFPNHEFALVELPNSYNPFDNNLLISCRRI